MKDKRSYSIAKVRVFFSMEVLVALLFGIILFQIFNLVQLSIISVTILMYDPVVRLFTKIENLTIRNIKC